tara:strand:- start:4123 stop:4899 length:777 start_codon:yes stop_codon:yes gene_type:complete
MDFNIIFEMKGLFYRGAVESSIVYFYAYGGGFRQKMSIEAFNSQANVVDGIPDVSIEAWVNINGSIPVKGYVNPHRLWNGWVCPLFDEKQSKIVCEHYMDDYYRAERSEGSYLLYQGWTTEEAYENGVENRKDRLINVGGKEIAVNSLHDGLCWEIVSEVDAIAIFFLHEVAKYLDKSERLIVDAINRESGSVVPGKDVLWDVGKIGDVNMVMKAAFVKVFPKDWLINDSIGKCVAEYDTKIWNAAWKQAKEWGYGSI